MYLQPSRKQWMGSANCVGNREFIKERPRIPSLKKICGACPVRYFCLNYAVANDEKGYWAGTTEKDRLGMKDQLDLSHVPIEERNSFQKEPVRGLHSSENPLPQKPLRKLDLSFLDRIVA